MTTTISSSVVTTDVPGSLLCTVSTGPRTTSTTLPFGSAVAETARERLQLMPAG